MGTDPFDEFEFKPLTDGLGFHNQKAAPAMSPTGIVTRSANVSAKTAIFEFDQDMPSFKAPLPRRDERTLRHQVPAEPSTSGAVDDILNTLKKNRKLEIEADHKARQEFRSTKHTDTWKTASPRFSPMFLDALLVTAASLFCLIVMLMVTHVDLIRNLTNPDSQGMIYLATGLLVLTVCFVYTVSYRLFLGYTPGEWAYDMRLGRTGENESAGGALKIVARQLLITATGIITLPILGFITGQDIAGMLTGTRLMRKV